MQNPKLSLPCSNRQLVEQSDVLVLSSEMSSKELFKRIITVNQNIEVRTMFYLSIELILKLQFPWKLFLEIAKHL